MKNKIRIYYVRSKTTDPNERWYYISNYYGGPFYAFTIGEQTVEQEIRDIADYLGLKTEHLCFLPRGPKYNVKSKKDIP